MRNLDECKTEIFRLSEKRITEKRKKRRRVISLCVPVCILLTVLSVTALPSMLLVSPIKSTGSSLSDKEEAPLKDDSSGIYDSLDDIVTGNKGNLGLDLKGPLYGVGVTDRPSDLGSLESFSFSLVWGPSGISSYDSASGKLVKSNVGSRKDDYVTEYRLTDAEKETVYRLIKDLDITSYPDVYDPQNGKLGSDPSMTVILSVKTDKVEKTVTAEEIALLYTSDNEAGQRFLTVCRNIEMILTSTEAWKALPEPEFFFY